MEKKEKPQPIRPKAFKPGGSSKLPPNLDIDNQPVSGVRKPYQPQQPPMAQPLNMAQVPPMADPPIKEQPVYQPFTPPTPQAPNSNGNFSTGLGMAILALFPCCGFNIFAIIAIVLSVIAGGEYKRGEYEMATKHAKTAKTLSIIAIVFAVIIWIFLLSFPTDDNKKVNTPDQEQVKLDPIKEKQRSDYFKKLATEPIDNLPQSKTDIKIDIKPASDNSDRPIDVERINAIRKELLEKRNKLFRDNGITRDDKSLPGEDGLLVDEEIRKRIKEKIEKSIREREKLQDLKPPQNE